MAIETRRCKRFRAVAASWGYDDQVMRGRKIPLCKSIQKASTSILFSPFHLPLLHLSRMDKLRQQARAAIERDPWNRPDVLPAAFETTRNTLSQLWQDVSSHDSSNHVSVS